MEHTKEISAGAVIYTLINSEIHYLLIKDTNGNWGFPKGHLEKGETELEAALREIKEEVGINVDIDSNFREELVYPLANTNMKHSIYFVACYIDQSIVIQPEEVVETMLLKYDEAVKLLTFENMKDVLNKAHRYLSKL